MNEPSPLRPSLVLAPPCRHPTWRWWEAMRSQWTCTWCLTVTCTSCPGLAAPRASPRLCWWRFATWASSRPRAGYPRCWHRVSGAPFCPVTFSSWWVSAKLASHLIHLIKTVKPCHQFINLFFLYLSLSLFFSSFFFEMVVKFCHGIDNSVVIKSIKRWFN